MKELCGLLNAYTCERLVIFFFFFLLLLASPHLAFCFLSRQLFSWVIHLCFRWRRVEVSPDT